MKVLACFLLVAVPCALASVKLHPFSDEFIAHINSQKPTWKAGRNFDISTPTSYIRKLTGTILQNTTGVIRREYEVDDEEIPASFDAREAWPKCSSVISTIRDQAACGSCWAVAAVEAMSDRICIASDGETQVSVSAEDLLDCCGLDCGYGCGGGFILGAWSYWKDNGIVTGGEYGSLTGCKAYSIAPCAHHIVSDRPACGSEGTPTCVRTCDASSSLDYQEARTFGKDYYYVAASVKQIQKEILTYGPVEAGFDVYDDFLTYKSGVYQHVSGDLDGGHAVKILGWGVEDDVPYWLVANSWNTDWGDEGYFKIIRGEDHLGIESQIAAGHPRL